MTQTAIPVEFENYLQSRIADNIAPTMNQIVFAYIPGLDSDAEIDRSQGLPSSSYWVHQQDVDQAGKINENTLVYSVVIPSSVPAFTFNAIYLYDKNETSSCGMVVHKATETKENGMSSTKSLLQQYSGAALISNITVDASTWQIDYHARLVGIEEDHRLTCLDSYGHTAFIEGFEVVKGTTQYSISPGLVYIGGLRGKLNAYNGQTVTTKPNNIYITLHREGTALSKWENVLTITQSETEISDYTDSNGVDYYVAKLATINADGSISDHRTEQTGELERADNFATDDDITNESTENKHIKLSQLWDAISNKITSAFSSRTISTVAPLTGGGDLSADRELSINNASTSSKGVVKLNSSTNSTSTTEAATPSAVKQAFALADSALKDDASSLNANGYIKFNNGLIMQWGNFVSNLDENQVVNFPIAFPNTVFSVSGGGASKGGTGLLDDADVDEHLDWSARHITKSSFSANRENTVDGTDVYFSYFAIGM